MRGMTPAAKPRSVIYHGRDQDGVHQHLRQIGQQPNDDKRAKRLYSDDPCNDRDADEVTETSDGLIAENQKQTGSALATAFAQTARQRHSAGLSHLGIAEFPISASRHPSYRLDSSGAINLRAKRAIRERFRSAKWGVYVAACLQFCRSGHTDLGNDDRSVTEPNRRVVEGQHRALRLCSRGGQLDGLDQRPKSDRAAF